MLVGAIVIVLTSCVGMRFAEGAPAAAVGPQAAELVPTTPPGTTAPSAIADTPAVADQWTGALVLHELSAAVSPDVWFAPAGPDLNALSDKSDVNADPAGCLSPEVDALGAGAREDDCQTLKPGADKSTRLTLPFLAALGWVLVILAVAGGYRLYRDWRLHRWVQSLRAQGLVFGPARRRRDATRRASGSSSSLRRASRSHTG